MKIWHLVDARNIGGIERHIATVVAALRARGYDAEAVLWRDYDGSPWIDQLRMDGVPHRTLAGSIASLVRAIRKDSPALIHTHGYKANLIGRTTARIFSIPVVSTYHSGDTGAFPVSLYLYADMALSFMAPRIAVSEEIAARLPYGAGVLSNFLIVPPVAPAGALPRRVGFIGRLSPEKGPDLFCEIASRAAPGLEWHVWGDGPMRAELEARYGRTVTFHGVTLDVGEALTKIGLLLMPSRAEGLPMAALEALAAGIPLAVSRVGGLPELVRPNVNGWLFEPGDVATALACIDTWRGLDEAAMEQIRTACHATANDRYSDRAILPALLDIYREAGFYAAPGGVSRSAAAARETHS